MTKNAVAKKEEAGLPATYDYGDDVGAGFEGTTSADLSIPFLGVLQAMSPQVESNDPEGSTAGMIINTVTSELYDGDAGVVFLPCKKEHVFVEWTPRDDGGGMVGRHEPDSDIVRDALERIDGDVYNQKLKNGDNDLAETFYVYGLVLDAAGDEVQGFAIVSFGSTKIKPYKAWYTSMMSLRGKPPIFANRAVLKTVKQKNKKGTFYNFRISPLATTWRDSLIDPSTERGRGLLAEAKSFLEMVNTGAMTAAFDTERAAGSDAATPDEDSEAPF